MTVPAPIRGADPYRPPAGGPPCDLILDGRAGLCWPDAGPPPAVPEADYPDTAPLASDLAARWSGPPDRVVIGAGADDVLDRACRAYLGPGRRAVLTDPTFVMLPRYAAQSGATVQTVPWTAGPLPVDRLRAAAAPSPGLIAVVTPNNPTGLVAGSDDLARLAAAAPTSLLVVDLAYVEFADHDPTAELLRLPSVLVVRTFSKAWGLASRRVGYGLAHPAVAAALRAAGGPYPTSAAGLELARRRLATGADHLAGRVAAVRRERRQLTALLGRLGGEVAPSQANFVLVRHPRAAWLGDGLAGAGIAARRLGADALRISLPGDRAAARRLRRAVATALAPRGLHLALARTVLDDQLTRRFAARLTVTAGRPPTGGPGRQWLLTDTPAAASAARRAGAIPVGLATAAAGAEALTAAGCGRVLRDPAQLLEVLP